MFTVSWVRDLEHSQQNSLSLFHNVWNLILKSSEVEYLKTEAGFPRRLIHRCLFGCQLSWALSWDTHVGSLHGLVWDPRTWWLCSKSKGLKRHKVWRLLVFLRPSACWAWWYLPVILWEVEAGKLQVPTQPGQFSDLDLVSKNKERTEVRAKALGEVSILKAGEGRGRPGPKIYYCVSFIMFFGSVCPRAWIQGAGIHVYLTSWQKESQRI